MNKETIIRVPSRDRWLHMDVRPLEDTRLSFKAKGILAYLLGKPDDWCVRITDLIKRSTDGEHAIRSGLQELEEAGYIRRSQDRKEDGTFEAIEYIVHEQPLCGFPEADNPDAGFPQADNHPVTNDHGTNDHDTKLHASSPEDGEKRELTPAQENFEMLARVCKIDLDVITPTLRGKLNQLEGLLRKKKNTTTNDIYQFGLWWYRDWWQGQDGQPPRPMQIRDQWGVFTSQRNAKGKQTHERAGVLRV